MLEAEQFAKCQQLSGDTGDTSGGVTGGKPSSALVLVEAAVGFPGLGSGLCPAGAGTPLWAGLIPLPQPWALGSAAERLLQTPARAASGICRAGSSLIRGMQMGPRKKVPGKGKAAHEREFRQERGNYSHSPKVYF